jgi:hypothetical protein
MPSPKRLEIRRVDAGDDAENAAIGTLDRGTVRLKMPMRFGRS